MWGSLASIGLPDRVREPATTQLFEPPIGSDAPAGGPSNAIAPAPTGTRPAGPADPPPVTDGTGSNGISRALLSPVGTIDSSSASRMNAMNAAYSGPSPSVRLASSGTAITQGRPVSWNRHETTQRTQSSAVHGSGS